MGDHTQTQTDHTVIKDMPKFINIILKVSENEMTLDVIKYLVVLRNMSHVGILSIVNNNADEGVNPSKLKNKLNNNGYHFLRKKFEENPIDYNSLNTGDMNISTNLCVICKPEDTTALLNKIRGADMPITDYPVIIEYNDASDLETLIFGLITCFTKDSVMENLDKDIYNKLYKEDKNLKISLLENEISITDSKFKIKKGDNMVEFKEDMNTNQNDNNTATKEFKEKITKNKERLRLLHKIAENASDLYSTIDSNKLKLNKQVTVLISTIKQNATSDKKNQYHILEMAELEQSPVSTSGGGRRIEAAKQKFRNLKTRLRGLIKGRRTTKKGNVKYTGHEGNVRVKTKFIRNTTTSPNNAATAVINKLKQQKTTRADKYTIGVYYNNFNYKDKNKSISFIYYNLQGLKLIKFMLFNNVGAPVIDIIKAIKYAQAKYLPTKLSGNVETQKITNVNNPERDPHKIDKYESIFAELCKYVVSHSTNLDTYIKLTEIELRDYVNRYYLLNETIQNIVKPLLKDLLNSIKLLEDLTIKYLVTSLVYSAYNEISSDNINRSANHVLYSAYDTLEDSTFMSSSSVANAFMEIKNHKLNNNGNSNDTNANYADVFNQKTFQELFNKLKNNPEFTYKTNIYIDMKFINDLFNNSNITRFTGTINAKIKYFKLLSVVMDNSMTCYKKICTYVDNATSNTILRLPVLKATDTNNKKFNCDSIPLPNRVVTILSINNNNTEISYVLENVKKSNSNETEYKIIVMCKISNQYEIKTDRTHKNPIISFVIPDDYNELVETIYRILVGVVGKVFVLVNDDATLKANNDNRKLNIDQVKTQLSGQLGNIVGIETPISYTYDTSLSKCLFGIGDDKTTEFVNIIKNMIKENNTNKPINLADIPNKLITYNEMVAKLYAPPDSPSDGPLSGGSLSRKKQPRKLRNTKKRLYPKRK